MFDGPLFEDPLIVDPLFEGSLFEDPLFESHLFEDPLIEIALFEGPLFEGPLLDSMFTKSWSSTLPLLLCVKIKGLNYEKRLEQFKIVLDRESFSAPLTV